MGKNKFETDRWSDEKDVWSDGKDRWSDKKNGWSEGKYGALGKYEDMGWMDVVMARMEDGPNKNNNEP